MLTTQNEASGNGREVLAKTVSLFVICAVGLIMLIGGFLIFTLIKTGVDGKEVGEIAIRNFKDIISIILPILATWIGTVLAYYFSRENFESANKSVRDLVSIVSTDQKLRETKVLDASIPIDQITSYEYTTESELEAVLVSAFIKKIEESKTLRLPIIDKQRVVKYCIHRSIFDKFISIRATADPAEVAGLTFKDMKTTSLNDIKTYVTSGFAMVSAAATMYDCKIIMDNNKFVEDIFITQNGQKNEPILGWVTNNIIMEKSKI